METSKYALPYHNMAIQLTTHTLSRYGYMEILRIVFIWFIITIQ
jgi:hypothetical protein